MKKADPLRVACITWSKNESVFLQIWFKYYSSLFGAASCYLIDHASDRISPVDALSKYCDARELNIFRIPYESQAAHFETENLRNPFDHFRFTAISSFINGLLNYYDVVIYNDADEIFVVDPATGYDLPGYLKFKLPFDVLAGVGIEMLHDYKCEERIDMGKSILSQRRKFVYRIHHSKPHIIATPSRIQPHSINRDFSVDPNLFLMHLKFIDVDDLLERQKSLKELHSIGVGDPASRWRHDGHAIMEMLDEMLMRPTATQNFSAHKLFKGKQSMSTGRGTQTEMRGAFSKEESRKIHGYLNTLPESFRDIF